VLSENMKSQEAKNQKICPKCKEEIKKDALICRYCGNKLDLGAKLIKAGQGMTKIGIGLMLIVIIIVILLGLL